MAKRCAQCGQTYDEDYDGCPHCAQSAATQQSLEGCGGALSNLGCAMMLLPIALIGLALLVSTCSS